MILGLLPHPREKSPIIHPFQYDGCPVCLARRTRLLQMVGDRACWRCTVCSATYLDPSQRPSPAEELDHYRLHENDPDDPRYRRFLSRLGDPLLERLPPRQAGLDYGCGPGPALAAMLREAGHTMALYDPFFCPDPEPLKRVYDFVTCTETAEHFHHPAEDFELLTGLVRPGGWLAIMTCFLTEDAKFEDWHYRKDPTHVVFYSEATIRHLAQSWGWTCEIPVKDVALMRKH